MNHDSYTTSRDTIDKNYVFTQPDLLSANFLIAFSNYRNLNRSVDDIDGNMNSAL